MPPNAGDVDLQELAEDFEQNDDQVFEQNYETTLEEGSTVELFEQNSDTVMVENSAKKVTRNGAKVFEQNGAKKLEQNGGKSFRTKCPPPQLTTDEIVTTSSTGLKTSFLLPDSVTRLGDF